MSRPSQRVPAIFAVLTFLLGSLVSAAFAQQSPERKTTAQDVKSEVVDAAQAIKSFSVERRDEALKSSKAALDQLDARIERLEAYARERWSEMSQATRDQTSVALRNLKQERARVAEWYGGLQHGSAEAWDRLKLGFSEAYDALRASWRKTEKELEETE